MLLWHLSPHAHRRGGVSPPVLTLYISDAFVVAQFIAPRTFEFIKSQNVVLFIRIGITNENLMGTLNI